MVDALMMRARGIDHLGLSNRYWVFVVVAALAAGGVAWAGLVALVDVAFDPQTDTLRRLAQWMGAVAALLIS